MPVNQYLVKYEDVKGLVFNTIVDSVTTLGAQQVVYDDMTVRQILFVKQLTFIV